MKKLVFVLFIAATITVSGQNTMQSTNNRVKRCITEEFYQEKLLLNPDLAYQKQEFEENLTAQKGFLNNLQKDVDSNLLIIPVVVHVIWHTNSQNVSMTRIEQQIERLNLDYSMQNTDTNDIPEEFLPVASNVQIQFAMAQVDPDGAPTDGVTRTYTEQSSYTWSPANEWVKHSEDGGHDAWDTERYYNIWVCNMSGGILGYAQFPWDNDPSEDGVVILYSAFGNTSGSYNMGRTCTHETGHWLGLYHIWGDDGGACTGSDQVGDTPNQGSEYYGVPSYPQNSCGSNDMFMNYMDYVDDQAMVMFTLGQKTRIWSSINSYRPDLGQDSLHIPVPPLPSANNLSYQLDYNNVSLSWAYNADTSQYADNLIGFKIYRNDENVFTVSDTSLRTYVDSTLPDGIYDYYVKALFQLTNQVTSDSSNHAYVQVVTVFPPTNISAQINDYNVTLNWQAPIVKGALMGYEIYRDDELITTLETDTATSYTDEYLSDDLYEYYLRSYDEFEAFSDSSEHVFAEVKTLVDSFVASRTEVPGGESVQFNYETIGPVTSYHWTFYDGIADFDDIANPLVRYDSAGVFDVKLTVRNDYNVRTIFKADYITCLWNVGVNETALNTFQVYPNPATHSIVVRLNDNFNGPVNLQLFDLSGKRVQNVSVNDKQEVRLNIDDLTPGMYTLMIFSENETVPVKISIR